MVTHALHRWFRLLPIMVGGFVIALSGLDVDRATGAIITPDEVRFSLEDLELASNVIGAVACSDGANHANGSIPFEEDADLLELLRAILPSSSSSGSSSTSSSSGPVGVSLVLGLPAAGITLSDEQPRGQLLESRDLFLPAPPGTDLLRPPQA